MSYSYEEVYQVYNETFPCARKAHACDACRRTIRPGDVYTRVFILFDGTKRTVKRCLVCQAIHHHLRQLCPNEVWPDERLNCGETYEDEWGKPPPDELVAVAFMTADEAQKQLTWLVNAPWGTRASA